METTGLLHTILAAAAALAASAAVLVPTPQTATELPVSTRSVEISYTAHDGGESHATVLLPASYDGRPIPPGAAPPPRVPPPRGRARQGGETPRLGGDLPARLGFAVVNPDGAGA